MKTFPNLLVLLCVVFLTSAVVPPAKGYKYSSKEGKMTVSFPSEYEVTTTDAESAVTVKVSAVEGERTYFASYTLHDTPLSDREGLAQVSLDSFNETLKGTIINQSTWSLKGQKGLYAKITIPDLDAKIDYHVILVGQIQYQLVVLATQPQWDQKKADAFVKSFKMMK